MHRTYELFVQHPDGEVCFEALTHKGSPAELLRHVQELADARGVEAIEVRVGGDHLFTLMGRPADGRGD